MTAAEDGKPSYLYRCYSCDGKLLYVGVTYHLSVRFSQHGKNWPWFAEVERIEAVPYERRKYAIEAELRAIRDERPCYNRDQINREGGRMTEWEDHIRGPGDGNDVPGAVVVFERVHGHRVYNWRRAAKIENPETVRRWKRDGFPGVDAEIEEIPLDELETEEQD